MPSGFRAFRRRKIWPRLSISWQQSGKTKTNLFLFFLYIFYALNLLFLFFSFAFFPSPKEKKAGVCVDFRLLMTCTVYINQ